uniref:Cytochrome c oxidase assembly factor 5 n=1 Tax=Catagonus wagneri TaxID=51154 RepID=A0A8C3VQ31_9CETA
SLTQWDEDRWPGMEEDLGMSLLQSDCMLQEGKSLQQCLKGGNCKVLKYSFFECKRKGYKNLVMGGRSNI